MKKIIILSALILLAGSPAAFAQNPELGIYVGILGGWVNTPDISASGQPDIAVKNGYMVGAKVGYIPPVFQKWFAIEVEYNYIRADLDTGPVHTDGKIKDDAVMLNAYVRYPETFFHPYIGAGAGWSWFKLEQYTRNVGGARTVVGDATDNAFCWQLLAGIDFDLTKNFSAGVGYKYYRTKPNLGGPVNLDLDYRAHMVDFGLKYTF